VDVRELVLIRHAESTWNAEGRWQGQEDPPLSSRGRGQAESLAAALRGAGVERLLTSDLLRARATAEPIARALGLGALPDPRLRELDVGRWGGRTRAEIARADAELLARFDSGDLQVCAGGGESRASLRLRALAALRELAAAGAPRRVALVTHMGWLRAVLPGSDFAHAEWRVVPLAGLLGEDLELAG
jgi:broad specificity phosphatase PhoE